MGSAGSTRPTKMHCVTRTSGENEREKEMENKKQKPKKKGETREGKKYCLCVWTYRQYYNIYNSMYTYIYKPVYTCTAAEAAAVS